MPLRIKIWVAGSGEAERVVRLLDGKIVGRRKVSVKMIDEKEFEEREAEVNQVAGEMKVQIASMDCHMFTLDLSWRLRNTSVGLMVNFNVFCRCRTSLPQMSRVRHCRGPKVNDGHYVLCFLASAHSRHDKHLT